jgi:hypothetical protein
MASGRSEDHVRPITVWKLESGFFARDRELAAAMQAHEFSTRVIPEIDEATQFFRVRVDVPDAISRLPNLYLDCGRGKPDWKRKLDRLQNTRKKCCAVL